MTYGPEGLGTGKGQTPNYNPRPVKIPSSLILTYRAHSKGEGQGRICLDQSEAVCGPLLPQAYIFSRCKKGGRRSQGLTIVTGSWLMAGSTWGVVQKHL